MNFDKKEINDCETCGGKEFILSDGFYYCKECGNKNNYIQETEYEFLEGKKFNVYLKKEKAEVKKLTSWEEYNFILIGLVNEVININNDCPQLKLTTLQIWATYLKEIEAAFFSQEEDLPKLYAFYRKDDAEIIYGIKNEKPKRKRKAKTKIQTKNSKRIKKSEANLTQMILRSQQQNPNNETLMNMTLEQVLANRQIVKKVDYSSAGERLLRKHYAEKLVEDQLGMMLDPSMVLEIQSIPVKEKIQIVTLMTLVCLIYCALNVNKSNIQMFDLLRFIREGNLSFFQHKHFLPENYISTIKDFVVFKNRSFRMPTYEFMRRQVNYFIGIIPGLEESINVPDIISMCQRFLVELCLPPILIEYIKKLLKQFPFQRNVQDSNHLIENFEGRAMAYVVLALKLFYGLDDEYEIEMSIRIQRINMEILKLELNFQPLLDIVKWLEFLEYRNLILGKFYYSFSTENVHNNEYLAYIDLLHTINIRQPEDFADFKGNQQHLVNLQNLEKILNDLIREHNKTNDSIAFMPSMTPLSDNFTFLITHYAQKFSFDQNLIHKNFTECDIESFLSPEKLIAKFKEKNVAMKRTKIAMNENVRIVRNRNLNKSDESEISYELSFDVGFDKWKRDVQKTKERNEEKLEKKLMRWERQRVKLSKYNKEVIDFNTIYNCDSNDEDEDEADDENVKPEDTLGFPSPCFKLWHFPLFGKDENFKDLPDNFQRVMRVCAAVLNQQPQLIYKELLSIEVQIFATENNVEDL